jgi:hypothetical protein
MTASGPDHWDEIIYSSDEWPDEIELPPPPAVDVDSLFFIALTVGIPLGQSLHAGEIIQVNGAVYSIEIVVGETWLGGATKHMHLIVSPLAC